MQEVPAKVKVGISCFSVADIIQIRTPKGKGKSGIVTEQDKTLEGLQIAIRM